MSEAYRRVGRGTGPFGALICVALAACRPAVDLPVSGQFQITRNILNTIVTSLAIGDCNGDGLLDLASFPQNGDNQLLVRGADGTLTPKPLSFPIGSLGGTFVDLDGDGHQDLLLATTQALFLRGHGDCTFDAPVALTPKGAVPAQQVSVTDVDLDGLPDLVLTRSGMTTTPTELYLGRGDGTYTEVTLPLPPRGLSPTWLPWGTLWEDFDGDGIRDYMAVFDNNQAAIAMGQPGDLPSFLRNDQATTLFAPGGPMNVAPIDYKRDGHMEYYVSRQQPQLLAFHGKTAVDVSSEANILGVVNGSYLQHCGAFTLDADFDGWPDLLVLGIVGGALPGPTVLYHNNHNGTFSVAPSKVVPVTMDAHDMVCGDARSNGHVVCYGLPLTDNPIAIENDLTPAGNWVGIRLAGTVSSPEAEGARVSLSGATPPLTMYYGAQAPPHGQHDRGLLLPVGAQMMSDVDIAWPSGIQQHVSGLMAGEYTTISEPMLVTVAQRVVPADGQHTVDITVDPTTIGSSASVDIELTGDGTWMGAARQVGSISTRTLLAPNARGAARIQVTIGGQALLVRPRVTFLAQ